MGCLLPRIARYSFVPTTPCRRSTGSAEGPYNAAQLTSAADGSPELPRPGMEHAIVDRADSRDDILLIVQPVLITRSGAVPPRSLRQHRN